MSWERMPQADSTSWLVRPLEWLTRLVVRFPWATLLLALAAAGVSLWLTVTQLGFRTSRAELLSPTSDYNRRWLEYTKEFGDKEDAVVVVEGENRQQVAAAAQDLRRGLTQRSDLFAAVLYESDAPKLRAKGLFYLKPEELRRIDGFLDQAGPILQGDWSALNLGGMAHWMGAAMSGGPELERRQILAAMQTELPRVMKGLQAALEQPGSYESPWPNVSQAIPIETEFAANRLISDDGRMGLVLLKFTERDNENFAQNSEPISALRKLADDVQSRHPGTKLGLTGLPIIEFDEMRSSESSMSLATVLSFAGVLAIMIVAFGGFRHAILAMLTLVIAMLWTCGLIAVTIGHVNVLTIAFGSILFGLGIDYGIYRVTRYLQLRRVMESTSEALVATTASTGPGVLTSALTSAIAFFAAGFTDFPGVAQLGMLAGGGVLFCWLGESTVLPALIRLTDRDGVKKNIPMPLNLRYWLRPLFAWPRLTLAAALAATVATTVGLCHLRYDYNLLNLQPAGLESVDLEHKLFRQANRSAWFALSVAKTPEEVRLRKEAFLRLPSVERVVEVATAVPENVEQKRPLIENIHQRLAKLTEQTPSIPVVSPSELDRMLATAQAVLLSGPETAPAVAGIQQFREMLRNIPADEYRRRVSDYQQKMAGDLLGRLLAIRAASTPLPPAWADLPDGVAARFIGKSGQHLMQVYSKANIWEVGPMGQFVHDVREVDPEATGNPLQVYEASKQMKRSFEQAAWYALLVVVPVVLFDFRRLNHTLLAMLPMGFGLLQTLGLMGLLDIPLNQANIIVLPLTIGIGLEGGINLLHELRCQRRGYRGAGNAVIVAVVVNSLTTMVGFGALMIANHRGLQSLGRVLTLSMGCCLFSSLLLPNLLRLGRFGLHDESADADEEDADDQDDLNDFNDFDDDRNEISEDAAQAA